MSSFTLKQQFSNLNIIQIQNPIIMMKQIFMAVTFVMAMVTLVSAQNQTSTTMSQKTKGGIYLKKSFWGTSYVKDGEEYRTGFWAKNLSKEFKDCPEAMAEYKQCRKSLKNCMIVSLAGTATAITGLVLYAKRVGDKSDMLPNKKETRLYFGGLGTTIIAGSISATEYYNHINKAVFYYNESLRK